MIVACLIIMGSIFPRWLVNLDNTLGDLAAERVHRLCGPESLTQEQAKALPGQAGARLVNVSSATFVDRQAAMDQYVERRCRQREQGPL